MPSYFRFDDNAAVLLNNKREMLGTRIGGVVSADLRMRGWSKIVSLAPKVSLGTCIIVLETLQHLIHAGELYSWSTPAGCMNH